MMRRENGRVLIDISISEYGTLLLALGYAVGSAARDGNKHVLPSWMRLVNSINEGNPDWTPYEVDDYRNDDAREQGEVSLRPRKGLNPLSVFAEQVLRRDGKTHMSQLLERMRKEGWISTGDDRADMKNVFNTLSKTTRFLNLGRNVWILDEGNRPK